MCFFFTVGGFIVSHLRNLKTSADPDKQKSKKTFASVNTNKKYPFDANKYSFNSEYTHAFDSFGLSTTSENNVIYSQNSFLPTSATFNMSAEIFGLNTNFLEIDVRQENFHKILEHYLGPLGNLNQITPFDLSRQLDRNIYLIAKRLRKNGRSKLQGKAKRSLKNEEIDDVSERLRAENNFGADLDLDLSVKLFGSEVFFLNTNESYGDFYADFIQDTIYNKLEKEHVDETQHFQVFFLF